MRSPRPRRRSRTRGGFCSAIAALGLLAFLTPARANAAGWSQPAQQPAPVAEGIQETLWTSARPPHGLNDRIRLHRYRGDASPTAALLYLPGTNMNGMAAVTDENHNLWIFLARRGIAVYTLDYRTHAVGADALDDASFMDSWTMEAFVGDGREALALIRGEGEDLPIFVAGFSRGVWLAYGLVATEEQGSLAGLVALDGGFKSHRPRGRHDLAAALADFERSGNWASDVSGSLGWETRDRLMKAASADPQGPAESDDFETIGEQVSAILHGAWQPGGLTNVGGGISRVEILARLLAGYDRYYPTIQNLESAAIADYDDHPELALDDRWGELALPILYFGASKMGATWLLDGVYSAAKSGSRAVSIHVLEDYGHLDVLVGENARTDVFDPLLAWIRQHS